MLKAIILSAGRGTRLKPLTDKCPKNMLDIGGKPLLEHTINLLKFYGIKDIAINLHYYPNVITDYFGDGISFGVGIRYSYEEALLGSAGALVNFRDYFNDIFAIIYGDVFTNIDLSKMLSFHKKNKGIATVGLYEVDNPTECGIVQMDNKNRIQKFIEKPKHDEVFTNLANAGVYIANSEILDYLGKKTPYDFGSDLFPELLNKGISLYGYKIEEYLIDIGKIEKYYKAKSDYDNGRLVKC